MESATATELLEAQAHLWNHYHNFINTDLLFTAVELGIPDIIQKHGQPMTLSRLVESLQINPTKSECVYRMMRVLSHSGFFVAENTDENEEEVTYKLTQSSRLLLKDNPYGMTSTFNSFLQPVWRNSWRSLGQWLRNDEDTSFTTANGRTVFEYASEDPKMSELFDKSLGCEALVTATAVIEKKKDIFDGLRSLVDVGGGNGSMMKAISQELPNLKKIVLDLPHVVANLERSDNLSFVGGDMFKAVPPGDAVLLKVLSYLGYRELPPFVCVLHDWSDESCVKILKQCKKSIPSKDEGGKVLIIEIVMEDRKEDHKVTETQMFWDMAMMVYFKSKERSEKEWAKIFTEAGFSSYKIHPVLGVRSLIEVYP